MSGAAAAHVLVFPWPLHGHINVMLHIAGVLAAAGVHVTFLHTDHNLRRLLGAGAGATVYSPRPRLRFMSVTDGLPDDHPRAAGDLMEIGRSLRTAGCVAYRALLASLLVPAGSQQAAEADATGDGGFPPVTSVVADGLLTFAIDVAEELGVPALAFRTASACSFLAYLSVPRIVELGEMPFPPGGDLDEPVRGVPGMEGFLRRRDLPSPCRRQSDTQDVHPLLQLLVDGTAHSFRARALVLNTAASLEGPALAHIAPRMREVFAIGPLHAMSHSPAPAAASSLSQVSALTTSNGKPTDPTLKQQEEDGGLAWLDGQADRSVVYVSLGSLAVISHEQFSVLLSRLAAAGYPFLLVLRPDMVKASQRADLQEAVAAVGDSSKARVVEWAPQRDVLRHRAVGCFLTHAGWNSTVEAAVEGVPTVCWPLHVDQLINSRLVAAVWRTGLDMKDSCDADVVESMVREAMESAEIRASAQALARQVRRDVGDGGSSATELKRLVGFIRDLAAPTGHSRGLGPYSSLFVGTFDQRQVQYFPLLTWFYWVYMLVIKVMIN